LTVFTPSLAKIASKALVNLASRSRIRKRKEPIRSPRSMSRLRVNRDAQDVHPAGPHLHDEQHVQALEEDRAATRT
jgi:hypothetical protein